MGHISKVSAVVASAAALPLADYAAAQTAAPVGPGTTTYSFEGGVSFANLGRSDFPGGAVGFIPQDTDKTGSTPQSSGDIGPGHRTGGYGSFSVTRNIDAVNDWRFSTGFNLFGTATRSASASEGFTSEFFSGATNSAGLTESDRFGLYTMDFDFGRSFNAGIFKLRAFAGLRSLYEHDHLDTAFQTSGTDKTGFETNTTTTTTGVFQGRSSFYGLGPRVGLDFFTGSTFGVVGSISGAVLGGVRQSNYFIAENVVVNGGTPTFSVSGLTQNQNSWVGNISGYLGGAWQFSPKGQLVIGYKLDQWYNIRETFNFAGLNRKEDLLIQTPFIRVVLRF
jgi:Legionella pneumophila major outer membrane protein precursor